MEETKKKKSPIPVIAAIIVLIALVTAAVIWFRKCKQGKQYIVQDRQSDAEIA